jgi:hypothetical protein
LISVVGVTLPLDANYWQGGQLRSFV